MSLKDLNIEISYKSKGDNNISQSLVVPALSESIIYKRSVGYFSSGVIETILDGIVKLVRNGGKIQIIASPELSQADINAIEIGYEQKTKFQRLQEEFFMDFDNAIESLSDEKLKMLAQLISENILDIKIAEVLDDDEGNYHDKLGIFEDVEGNKVVFVGSSNESKRGYKKNYEKVRVFKSWDSTNIFVEDEEQEFQSLWDDTNDFVKTHAFSSALENHILQVQEYRKAIKDRKDKEPIELRDYQDKAISKWKENDYRGFFVMATGTGKTWTALYGLKQLYEEENVLTVICAPYKHLIQQWCDDIVKIFKDTKIVMVSSENQNWETELTTAIIERKYNSNQKLIVVSTIMSFYSDRFSKCIDKDNGNKVLIVDEAHRFTRREEILKEKYKYMLGLSATPVSGRNIESGKILMDYFGGRVFNLPIEEALGTHLINYNYHPIFVYMDEDKEIEFQELSVKMAGCFRNGICIDPERCAKYQRSRLRLISMTSAKMEQMDSFINQIKEKEHFIVYCGDGKLFNDTNNEAIRHINFVKKKLSEHGMKASQFTASESMKERVELIKLFNSGDIDSLVAIRCLDEGINIPSIKSALILSSNDNYREFVQRRGRILRKYEDEFGEKKEIADIYDVVVLPQNKKSGIAQIEFRRFFEYAKLALNKDVNIEILEDYMGNYNLNYEDITNETLDDINEGQIDE